MSGESIFQGPPKKGGRGQPKKSSLEKINLLLYHVESRRKLMEKLMNPSLSLEETSLLLDIAKSTIRNYTKSGILSCTRTPGGQRRFYLSEIVKFAVKRDGDGAVLDWLVEAENLIRQAQTRIATKKKLAATKEREKEAAPAVREPRLSESPASAHTVSPPISAQIPPKPNGKEAAEGAMPSRPQNGPKKTKGRPRKSGEKLF